MDTLMIEGMLKHWNGNVLILMLFSPLAAPEVVILTTSGAGNDESFIKIMAFLFKWIEMSNSKLLVILVTRRSQSIDSRSA